METKLIVGALYDSYYYESNREFGPFRYVGYDESAMLEVFQCSKPRVVTQAILSFAERMSTEARFVWRVDRESARRFKLIVQPYDPDQEPEDDCL